MPLTPGYQTTLGLGKLAGVDPTASVPTIAKFARVTKCPPFTIGHGAELDPNATYHGPEVAGLGRVNVELNAEGVLYSEGAIELALLSLLGDVVTTGATDPFTHTFDVADVVAASKAYMGAEIPIGKTTKAVQANVGFDKLEVSGGAGPFARFNAHAFGSTPAIVTKTAASLPANGLPFPGQHRTTLTVDGVATFRVLNWRWFLNHDRVNGPEAYDCSNRFRKGMEYLGVETGFEAEVMYDDAIGLDVWEKYLDADNATGPNATAGTSTNFAAGIKTLANPSGNEDSIEWTATKVALVMGDATPVHDARNLYRQKITGRALHTGTRMAQVILKNSSATI